VTIKYTYPRGGTTIYRRSVPTALRDRYPGPTIKKVFETTDPMKVGLESSAAVWGAYRRERDPLCTDPFEPIGIAGDGQDAKPRVPYTADQLQELYAGCRAQDDERRWNIGLLIDTGARLARSRVSLRMI
jgi:hypothetical protein